ncbi:MAG: hypothetical protein AAB535_01140, partial [Patescibacteria group bacterium]
MKGVKISLFLIFVLFLLVQRSLVFAESGCGGTEFCQSTKVVNNYDCKADYEYDPPRCNRVSSGTTTINCTVTETECYGYEQNSRCAYSQQAGGCYLTGRDKVSCCSGAGGGGYTCDGET